VDGVVVEDEEEELDDLLLGEEVAQGSEEGVRGLVWGRDGEVDELQDELIALSEEAARGCGEGGDFLFGKALTLSLSVTDVGSVLAVGELGGAEADHLAGVDVPGFEGL